MIHASPTTLTKLWQARRNNACHDEAIASRLCPLLLTCHVRAQAEALAVGIAYSIAALQPVVAVNIMQSCGVARNDLQHDAWVLAVRQAEGLWASGSSSRLDAGEWAGEHIPEPKIASHVAMPFTLLGCLWGLYIAMSLVRFYL